MGEQAPRRTVRRHAVHGPLPHDDEHTLGEEALHFTRWFAKSKYRLMAEFLGELVRAPEERDPARLRERFLRALMHAQRVLQVRFGVTFLLALGVVAAAASTLANLLDVAAPTGWLERAAAWSASLTVVLVAARLLLDRYLERCDVAATFLAIELAAAPRVKASSREGA